MSTLAPNPEAQGLVERARTLRAEAMRLALLRALDRLPRRLKGGRA